MKTKMCNYWLLFSLMIATPVFAKQWTYKNPMPTARYGLCSAVCEDNIYVIGGIDQNGNALGIVEKYDPESDSWDTSIASLNEPRYNAAAVCLDDKVYVIGGRFREDV